MAKGITIRVERAEALRVLGAAMRRKQQDFDRDKQQYPKKFEAWKKATAAKLHHAADQVERATTYEKANAGIEAANLGYKWRNQAPSRPELRLCSEKQMLQMLQMDTRDIVPINSNHELWSILQGKCEVKYGA